MKGKVVLGFVFLLFALQCLPQTVLAGLTPKNFKAEGDNPIYANKVTFKWESPNFFGLEEEELDGYRVYEYFGEGDKERKLIIDCEEKHCSVYVEVGRHKYRVVAYDKEGHESGYSNYSTVVVQPAPTITSCEYVDEKVIIKWLSNNLEYKNIKGFVIIRNGKSYTTVKASDAKNGEYYFFEDPGVNKGASYYYAVVAIDKDGHYSIQSNSPKIKVANDGKEGKLSVAVDNLANSLKSNALKLKNMVKMSDIKIPMLQLTGALTGSSDIALSVPSLSSIKIKTNIGSIMSKVNMDSIKSKINFNSIKINTVDLNFPAVDKVKTGNFLSSLQGLTKINFNTETIKGKLNSVQNTFQFSASSIKQKLSEVKSSILSKI